MPNAKQRAFVRKHLKENKGKGQAYQEVYKTKSLGVAGAAATRLLKNVNVKDYISDVRAEIEKDSEWAYQGLKKLTESNKTPASTKEKIYNSILDRGGLQATKKIEKTTHKYEKEFNLTKEEMRELLNNEEVQERNFDEFKVKR